MDTGGTLRDWRRRRRFSHLDLALHAGTTQRHVSFIESGRSVPGRGVLVRLAEAMDVPLRERNALLLAAGYAPGYQETALEDLGAVRTALGPTGRSGLDPITSASRSRCGCAPRTASCSC